VIIFSLFFFFCCCRSAAADVGHHLELVPRAGGDIHHPLPQGEQTLKTLAKAPLPSGFSTLKSLIDIALASSVVGGVTEGGREEKEDSRFLPSFDL
jgi:hypothetical protein